MAKPPLTAIRETIVKHLPATVLVRNDTITVGKVWLTEPPKETPYPAWLVGFGAEADLTESLDEHEENAITPQAVTGESHTYLTGDTHTKLDEKDVAAVTQVTGTRAGGPYTFVVNTDYKVVDEDGDGALDALEWQDAGNKPDNNTAVLTNYTHRLVQPTRAHLYDVQVIIHAIAQPLAVGQQGATERHRATEIVEAMQSALKRLFMSTIRPQLEALVATEGYPVTAGLPFRPGTPRKVEGTDTVQATNTFDAFYEEVSAVGAPYRTMRKGDPQVEMAGYPD